MMIERALLVTCLLMASPAAAQHNAPAAGEHKGHGGGHAGHAAMQQEHTPYAGQQTREIANLSADDLAALRRGAGWGLAKPAELNGLPGPMHVLELAQEMGLDAGQQAAVQTVFDEMRTQAIIAGEHYIQAEAALDQVFKDGMIDVASLTPLLEASAQALADLRAVHLAAHLRTTPLLSANQIQLYNELRGYALP